MIRERLREGGSSLDPLVDPIEHGLEGRVRDALAQNVERLDERHARLEQRRQLLVEHQEFPPRDPAAATPAKRQPWKRSAGLERKDVQPFLFQLAPEA